MAATAGTLVLRSISTGRTYNIDLYVPDAVATAFTFSPAGLAGTGSPATYRVPEDVRIEDISIAAAPTAVGATLNVNGAPIAGGTIRHANQLSSLNNRLKLNIGIKGGDFIGYTQF